MLYMAEKDFNISLSDSFMVGDGENDIIAGNAAGCRSVLIANKQEKVRSKPAPHLFSVLSAHSATVLCLL